MTVRQREEQAGLGYSQSQLEETVGRLWSNQNAAAMAEALRSLSPDIAHEVGRALSVYSDGPLDAVTRRILTIGVLAALGRSHELKSHIRGALQTGTSEEQIGAALLQVAFYAGIPAAIDGFVEMKRVKSA